MATEIAIETQHNYIGGKWVPSASGKTFEDRSPADRDDLVGVFAKGGKEDVDAAVAAAKKAFPGWRATPAPRLCFRAPTPARRCVAGGAHAVITLDKAGWHTTHKLEVPANISLLHLPPASPELNPTENVWQYLRQTYLSNRVFGDYDDVVEASSTAWNKFTAEPGRIASIASRSWTAISQGP